MPRPSERTKSDLRTLPSSHRSSRIAALSTLGVVAGIALLMLLPGTLAAPVNRITSASITTGTGPTATTGTGAVNFCPGTSVTLVPGGARAWLCMSASASNGSGYGRGWDQLQSNSTYSVHVPSGTRAYWGLGTLHLAAGFASVSGSCPSGASGYARAYLFWHVWVWDNTTSSWASQSNSGYIWDSGDVSCPTSGGSIHASSPAMVGLFNSSAYLPSTLRFSGSNTYTFVSFLGCTVEASLTTASSPASVIASCNPTGSAANTVLTHSVDVA